MTIGKFKVKDVSKDYEFESYGWLVLLPTIEYRHKYWYLWEFAFSWLKFYRRIQILKIDPAVPNDDD